MATALRLAERALGADPGDELRARVLVHRAYLLAETCSAEEGLRLLDEIDAAPGHSPAVRGLSAVNRGVVLTRRHAGRAVEEFNRALRLLPADEVEPRVAALVNRGCVRLDTGEVAAAVGDLRAAVGLARAEGLDAVVATASLNLGYALMLSGDIPAALHVLDDAEPAVARLSPVLAARCRVTRAETLTAAGLLDEAAEELQSAARVLGRHRCGYDQAEAELQLAGVLLTRDQPAAARTVAVRAARRFDALGASAQALQARRLRLQAQVRLGRGVAAAAEAAEAMAATFEELGLPDQAWRARLLAAEAHLDVGEPASARRAVGPARRARRGGRVVDRIRARHVRARLAEAEGRSADAGRELAGAMRDLHRHAGSMGSLELRAAVAVHAQRIALAGVRRALDDGRPAQVLAWAELTRGLSQRLPRVTPDADPEVVAWSEELRLLRARPQDTPDAAGPAGAAAGVDRDADAGEALARAAQLEHLLRGRQWQTGGPAGGAPASAERRLDRSQAPVAGVGAIRGALRQDGGTLLAVLAVEAQLVAVVVDRHGARLSELGPLVPVLDLVRRLRADLDLLATGEAPAAIRRVARGSTDTLAHRLDAILLAPLRARADDGPVLVAPAGALSLVPWGLLPGLRGRPVTVSATASSWLAGRTRGPLPARVGAVSGPGLGHADAEISAVRQAWAGARVVVAPRATAARTLEVAGASAVFHAAAHGVHEPQSPLFSHLLTADGPLFGHELHGMARPPLHVVLSACELGCAETRPGDERLGMTAALLAGGVGSVVAGVARVGDGASALVAEAHHRGLAGGASPAAALAAALQGLPAEAPPAPFVCFGAGW